MSVIIAAPAGGHLVPGEPVTPPDAPTGVFLSDYTSNAVQINWAANVEPDIQDYRVYLSTTGLLGDYTLVGTVPFGTEVYTDNTYSPTGLDQYYKVTARDNVGSESDFSTAVYATHLPVACGVAEIDEFGVATGNYVPTDDPEGLKFTSIAASDVWWPTAVSDSRITVTPYAGGSYAITAPSGVPADTYSFDWAKTGSAPTSGTVGFTVVGTVQWLTIPDITLTVGQSHYMLQYLTDPDSQVTSTEVLNASSAVSYDSDTGLLTALSSTTETGLVMRATY